MCLGKEFISVNNSIFRKIRTHTLVMGIATAAVFIVLITAGLLIIRQAMVSAGNRLGDSAATDARRILIEQTENELSRLAQNKAAVGDEKMSSTAEYIGIISQIATNIKSNPGKYGRREISFPDTTNKEGKVTVMVQIPNENATFNSLRDEIGLMANIQDILFAIQTNNKSVGTTYVGTEYGVTVCADPDSARKTPYFDPRTRVWYKNAKQANDLIWTDVFEDYLGRGLAITCAKPFYDAAGNIAGVAGMGMFLVVLSEEVVGSKIGETGYAFIINEKGEMIISDTIKKDENGNIIRENILESSTFPHETALKMINGEEGIEHVFMDGKEKLIAYHGLSTVPWSLAVIIDTDEIISPALMLENNIISLKKSTLALVNGEMFLIAALVGIIIVFIIGGVMYFSERLAKDITEPIQKLTSDAALIGAGDLEHILEIKTGDELEMLADSFNSMIVGIKTITAEKEHFEVAIREKTREAEIIQEANQFKSRFLATMSHEIRTPLNAIIGIMEIQLQKEDNPPDTKDAFEKIFESGNLLLNIINDILDFSKIEEGKMEIVPFQYDVPSLINDTVQLNYLYCENKPIKFIVSVDVDTPLQLFGDGFRIKQILNNLLSNAFKYTDEGEVEFSVFPEPASASSEDLIIVFRIRDTGQGIPQEYINRLFEDYMRFNRDLNRTIMGTGLGLSITKRLLNLMNGEIIVESQSNKGSVFTVRLPQKRVGDAVCGEENARQLREFDFPSTAIARKTQIVREYMPYGSVLVVDDVKSNLFVARGLLALYGLKIDAVDSGEKAINKIKDGNVYDIIFMDHLMPVMDGIEATKIIRGMDYNYPIVALTANAIVGQAELFIQNGFNSFISKPIDSHKLNDVLNEFIRDKKTPEIVEAARRQQLKKQGNGKESLKQKNEKISELENFFLIDAKNVVNNLEKIYANINALGEKEIESYEINVHSMKSALANIGETKVSNTAYELEQAAKNKNLEVMSKETPAFLDKLKSLIEKLSSEKDSSSANISDEDAAFLKEKLPELKTACEKSNKKAAKAAIKDLKQKKWPHKINEVLDELSSNILHSDFDKAVTIVENFDNLL